MNFKELQEYFNNQENVILAFIFGSTAKGMALEDSDLDIAVYLNDENDEDRIWLELGRITQKKVDLVLINKASMKNTPQISLKEGILKDGQKI